MTRLEALTRIRRVTDLRTGEVSTRAVQVTERNGRGQLRTITTNRKEN